MNDPIHDFVSANVWACVSDLGEYFPDEDFDNLYDPFCYFCGERINTHSDDVEYDEESDIDEILYTCPNCGGVVRGEFDLEPKDICEYWIVSPFLGERLREYGEPVIERSLGWIWGRTCTGQNIELDSVIVEICEELGVSKTAQNGQ